MNRTPSILDKELDERYPIPTAIQDTTLAVTRATLALNQRDAYRAGRTATPTAAELVAAANALYRDERTQSGLTDAPEYNQLKPLEQKHYMNKALLVIHAMQKAIK